MMTTNVTGELVTALAHDLRQPLTAVEMNISAAIVLLERPIPRLPEAIDALTDALEQQRRVRDALQVLQHLATQQFPHDDVFDLSGVVREVASLVQHDAIARGVAIELDLDGKAPAIAGDLTLVRQALVSIVRDAIDATVIASRSRGATPVRIAVRNAAPDSVAVQVHHAGNHRPNGLISWNLALARSVVAVHGASLSLLDEPASGATVITQWPAHPSSNPPRPALADG